MTEFVAYSGTTVVMRLFEYLIQWTVKNVDTYL